MSNAYTSKSDCLRPLFHRLSPAYCAFKIVGYNASRTCSLRFVEYVLPTKDSSGNEPGVYRERLSMPKSINVVLRGVLTLVTGQKKEATLNLHRDGCRFTTERGECFTLRDYRRFEAIPQQ